MIRRKINRPEEFDEFSLYSEDVRQQLLEDDALSPAEEAFMNGYEGAI